MSKSKIKNTLIKENTGTQKVILNFKNFVVVSKCLNCPTIYSTQNKKANVFLANLPQIYNKFTIVDLKQFFLDYSCFQEEHYYLF